MSGSDQLLKGLNPRQREAVTQTEGPVLVLAGAGSGKTRVITQRIAYILAKRLAKPSEILAVTFTNKAAAEMRERVAGLVGQKRAEKLVISTFHSFCLRVLRSNINHMGYRKNFTISGEGDARTFVQRVLDDMDGVREGFSPQTFMEHISAVKSSGQEAPELTNNNNEEDKYATFLPEIYERYQASMRAANMLDFDDLLALTLKLWREHPAIRKRHQKHFRYVMVDEYQDTNQVQYGLMRTLVDEHRNFCVVGDDDQSIYGWRGASISNILDFEKDFPEAKVIALEQNYRSTETILEAANSVIANNRKRREKRLWSKLGKGRPIDWFVTGNEEHEAKMAAEWLKYIQSKSEAKYSDFAILYRSNLQSRQLEVAFRQAQIPYVVVGGQEFFDRAEVRDVVAYLNVIANPRNEAAFLRIINMPRRGVGNVAVQKIHDICLNESIPFDRAMAKALKRGLLPSQAEGGIRELLEALHEFRQRFKEKRGAMSDNLEGLLDAIGYRDEIARTAKTSAQLTNRWLNVETLVDTLADYESDNKNATLVGFMDESKLNSNDRDWKSKDERRKSSVTLMTVHSAKGLEFPFVFIVGVEDGLIPHEKSLKDAALEEERRLFYVALTRGKRHVTLFEAVSRCKHGKQRMSKTSRFISEIPEALLTKHIRAARDMIEEFVQPPKPKPKKRRSRRGVSKRS